MTKKLQQQRDNYIAILNHDLKPPTIALVRSLELLLKESLGILNNEQKYLLKLMLDSSHYMYFMLNTLIAAYKYENKEIRLKYDSFNILLLLEECIAEFDRLIKYTGQKIKIQSELNDTSTYINADRFQLKRVINTLLANSISYSNTDSDIIITVNDIIEYDIPKLCIKFTYQSNSKDKKTFDNIFKKYTTHKDKFNRVGAGLGLYLSKQIIETHNGNVFCSLEENKTNSFGFTLNK